MPFIGTQPEVGGYSVLDALTASATASYTLQLNSANFVPASANQLLVSLNGVIQKPGSSFTVSGSTLTFSSALDSTDSIDFIISMGEPLLIGTPSDGTVSTAKIAADAITSAKIATNAVRDELPAGAVVQTVSTTKVDTFTSSSSSLVDITGMTVTITPKYSTSKILIRTNLNWGGVTNIYAGIRLLRGSTLISHNSSATGSQTAAALGVGGDNDNFQYKLEHTGLEFLDSPATTSATTYKLQQQSTGGPGTNTWYLNRPHNADNGSYIVHGTSSMTVQEIRQ